MSVPRGRFSRPNDQLPANVDAERIVLGAILMDDSQFEIAGPALQPDDFSLERHRRIFRRMGDVRANDLQINPRTVMEELKHNGELRQGDLSYLVELDDGMPQIVDLESYVKIILEKSNLRRIICVAQHTLNLALSGQSTSTDILSKLQHELEELSVNRTPCADPRFYSYTDLVAADLPPPTPIAEEFLNEGETVCLVGKPKQGKSRLVQQFAIDISRGRSFLD